METERYDSLAAYLEDVEPFLVAREAEHNLPLGILGTLRDHPEVYREPPYLGVVHDGPAIALVALRTPPFGLVLSQPGVEDARIPAAVASLVAHLAAQDPELPGVLGPPSVVASFVEGWSAATGREARREMSERIYRLERVTARPSPPGRWRVAVETDLGLLVDWIAAFEDEALGASRPIEDRVAMVERWIRLEGRAAYLWESDGRVVSLVGVGSPTPHGIRVGPVYTPPSDRGRGYATALTAAASQDQLDAGRRFCYLFTDLANPTSNHIYQAIGYEPVADMDQYAVDDPDRGASVPAEA